MRVYYESLALCRVLESAPLGYLRDTAHTLCSRIILSARYAHGYVVDGDEMLYRCAVTAYDAAAAYAGMRKICGAFRQRRFSATALSVLRHSYFAMTSGLKSAAAACYALRYRRHECCLRKRAEVGWR